MNLRKTFSRMSGAIACSMGLAIFSLFIHTKFPLRILSFSGLILSSILIGKQFPNFLKIKFNTKSYRSIQNYIYLVAGLTIGLIISLQYRYYIGLPLFPKMLKPFALIALSIGILEEIVFRGAIQEWVKEVSWQFSVAFASFSHTAYKCCLFALPFMHQGISLKFLCCCTFLFGLIFGLLKHFSGKILPSAAAHALFDVMVYGSCLSAPGWVW